MPFELIDTHVHIWDLENVAYPWLEGNTSILNRTYHINELEPHLANAAVSKGILVQASSNFDDTNAMLQVAEEQDLDSRSSWLVAINATG